MAVAYFCCAVYMSRMKVTKVMRVNTKNTSLMTNDNYLFFSKTKQKHCNDLIIIILYLTHTQKKNKETE